MIEFILGLAMGALVAGIPCLIEMQKCKEVMRECDREMRKCINYMRSGKCLLNSRKS